MTQVSLSLNVLTDSNLCLIHCFFHVLLKAEREYSGVNLNRTSQKYALCKGFRPVVAHGVKLKSCYLVLNCCMRLYSCYLCTVAVL